MPVLGEVVSIMGGVIEILKMPIIQKMPAMGEVVSVMGGVTSVMAGVIKILKIPIMGRLTYCPQTQMYQTIPGTED